MPPQEAQEYRKEQIPINLEPLQTLSLNQRVLCFAGLREEDEAVLGYAIGKRGDRVHTKVTTDKDTRAVAEKFKRDPKEFLAYCHQNLMRLKLDPNIDQSERGRRFNRYLDNYLDLVIRLDRAAFPPSDQLYKGIPEYIPDGLSDWGSDDEPDPSRRSREKLRVNKREIFNQARPLFEHLFSLDRRVYSDEKIKQIMVDEVARYVYNLVNYDWDDKAHRNPLHSVPLSDVADKRLGVCRHQALYTQVLLQALGISSKLLKSELIVDGKNIGPHVNNLVRINGKWHVLDVTNPEEFRDPTTGQRSARVFLKPISDSSIDLNNLYKSYQWEFREATGKKKGYKARKNMYYKIRDNRYP